MMLRFCSLIFLALTVLGNKGTAFAADEVPREIQPFVEVGTIPISISRADLDGDGLDDFVLVLERQKSKESDPDIQENQRLLLILIRQADGRIKEAKRNTKIVYCSTCGGMMGDPFEGIEVGLKTFTVSHYGGSAWRWSTNYQFNYSRKDNTWQLVKVEESHFHASEPEQMETKIYTPPKNFGKIDITDFDPENWKNIGSR